MKPLIQKKQISQNTDSTSQNTQAKSIYETCMNKQHLKKNIEKH